VQQVIAPLLQTLEGVHQRGVIHRDIKPENLFLTQAGVLRLGDWGLAINQLQEKAYSRVGTLDYMAPEVGPLYTVKDLINAAGQLRCLACLWVRPANTNAAKNLYRQQIQCLA
jgi:serine/threonine protein kinase